MQDKTTWQEEQSNLQETELSLDELVKLELESRRKKRAEKAERKKLLLKRLSIFLLPLLIPVFQYICTKISLLGGELHFYDFSGDDFLYCVFRREHFVTLILSLLSISVVMLDSPKLTKAMTLVTACVLTIQIVVAVAMFVFSPLGKYGYYINGSSGPFDIYVFFRVGPLYHIGIFLSGLFEVGYIVKNVLALLLFKKMTKN